MNPKTNAKTSAYMYFFSPKIGGDTEGVEYFTSYTPLTFCGAPKTGGDTEGVEYFTSCTSPAFRRPVGPMKKNDDLR